MPNVANVSTGKPKAAGAVFRAPSGTALPTDANTALAEAYKELGYVSEDGVTNNNSPDSDTIKAWGGQTVLVVVNEKTDEWTLTFLESGNIDVLKTVYGDANVTVNDTTGMITVTANADQLPEAVYVIDMRLNGGGLKRVVIPNGSISEIGEIVYKDDEPIGYEVTLQALPTEAGTNHIEYIQPAT